MHARFLAAFALCGTFLAGTPASALPGAPPPLPAAAGAAAAQPVAYRHRRYRPGGPHYYHVNRYGYGNYRRGPNGSFGGYPAGSAGAIELQNNHRIKCRNTPSRC